jgi:hypothetical protein
MHCNEPAMQCNDATMQCNEPTMQFNEHTMQFNEHTMQFNEHTMLFNIGISDYLLVKYITIPSYNNTVHLWIYLPTLSDLMIVLKQLSTHLCQTS